MITVNQLANALGIPSSRAAIWIDPLIAAITQYEINTVPRLRYFLAQVGWESCSLTAMRENLNYSEPLLRKYFGKRFNEEEFAMYARRPQAIANRVYANRLGNGDEASGDGWKYRGGGPIQLTFKNNYLKYGKMVGVDLIANTETIAMPVVGIFVAAAYWQDHGCNELADQGDFEGVTKAINGGLNNLAERKALLLQVEKVIV